MPYKGNVITQEEILEMIQDEYVWLRIQDVIMNKPELLNKLNTEAKRREELMQSLELEFDNVVPLFHRKER